MHLPSTYIHLLGSLGSECKMVIKKFKNALTKVVVYITLYIPFICVHKTQLSSSKQSLKKKSVLLGCLSKWGNFTLRPGVLKQLQRDILHFFTPQMWDDGVCFEQKRCLVTDEELTSATSEMLQEWTRTGVSGHQTIIKATLRQRKHPSELLQQTEKLQFISHTCFLNCVRKTREKKDTNTGSSKLPFWLVHSLIWL